MYESGLNNPTAGLIFHKPLIVGDNFEFSMNSGNYGSSEWTATIVLAAGTSKLVAAAIQEGNRFKWDIPGTETSELVAGPYLYNVSVSNGTDRRTLQRGGVKVDADISLSANVLSTSMLRRQLEACDNSLLILLNQQASQVTYAGKSYAFQDIEKLYAIRNNLRVMVQDEDDALRGDTRARKIIVSFRDI